MESLFRKKVARIKEARERERKIREIELEKRKEQFLKPAIHAKKLLEELIAEDKEFEEYLWERIELASWGIPLRPLILDSTGPKGHEDSDFLALRRHWTETTKNISLSYSEPAVLGGAHSALISRMQTKEDIIELLVDKLRVR